MKKFVVVEKGNSDRNEKTVIAKSLRGAMIKAVKSAWYNNSDLYIYMQADNEQYLELARKHDYAHKGSKWIIDYNTCGFFGL